MGTYYNKINMSEQLHIDGNLDEFSTLLEGGDEDLKYAQTNASLYEADPEDLEHVKDRCNCCCCFCNCSNRYTRDLSCFGCFPLKCGIICIGLFTIVLNFCLYVEVF